MNRSNVIKSLRPEIPNLVNNGETTDIKLFQNEVLRPILKFQNEVLVHLFVCQLKKREADISKMNITGRKEYVTKVVQNDLGLRNVLIGVVLGLMTAEEVSHFFTHETEYRRRIIRMMIDRLADQLV